MKSLSKVLILSACAAVLAAAPSFAQDGPGPDGVPAAGSPAPGTPQDGPDGAPAAASAASSSRRGAATPGRGNSGSPAYGRQGSSSPWGRGGPSPAVAEKMQKVEELDGKLWPLIQKVRDAAAKDKPALKAELRKAIAALFDAHLALAEEAQKSHEKQAAEMKARIARRRAQREALIDKKLSETIGEDDDDWD
jgi:hypothetical protein